LNYFCADETARKTAYYTTLNRHTVEGIYTLLRERILTLTLALAHNKKKISGEIEID